MPNYFAFILNPLVLIGGQDSIEIMPNYFIQKADSNQINILKNTWPKLPASFSWLCSHECDYGFLGMPLQEPIKLSSPDWRYWVIVHKGQALDYKRKKAFFILECALLLLQNDLEIGPLFLHQSTNGYQWNPHSLYNYFLSYLGGFPLATQITMEEIKEIGIYHALIEDFFYKMNTITIYPKGQTHNNVNEYYQENFQHIEHAIQQFIDLKALPRYSGLTIIGLFSIIESLITHLPKQNVDDSINHQIKTKIPLLRKKFRRTLDYEKYFAPANEETIWGKLYDFRSKVVHEGNEKIGKDNSVLKSLDNVTDFLKETVKLLILFAIKEPQLLTDLKKC